MKTPTFRPTKCYAGISCKHIDTWAGKKYGYDDEPPMPAVFSQLASATHRYQCVQAAIIVPDTPAYRAAIASVTKKATPKPARSRRKAKP